MLCNSMAVCPVHVGRKDDQNVPINLMDISTDEYIIYSLA